MSGRRRRATLVAILVGLVATATVVALDAAGQLEWLELRTLDLRFAYANPVEPTGEIISIDIDDGALALVGRWPWPRYTQAALVRVPAELGARAILIDLTWVDPAPLEADVGQTTESLDGLLDVVQRDPAAAGLRLSDYELRAALAASGSAYLACHYHEHDPLRDPAVVGSGGVVDLILSGAEDAARARAEELQQPGDRAALSLFERARLVAALATDAEALPQELSRALGLPLSAVAEEYDAAQQAALRRTLRAMLAEAPGMAELSADALAERVLQRVSTRPAQDETPLRDAARDAAREVLNYAATVATWPELDGRLASAAVEADALVPVYYLLAQAARRCGFTPFEADVDGVVRRVPLLVQRGEEVLPQLALGVACDRLGVVPTAARERNGRARAIELGGLRVQIDERGHALVPWLPQQRWWETFGPRVPADALVRVQRLRRMIAGNAAYAERGRAELLTAYFTGLGAFEAYARERDAVLLLRAAAEQARLVGDRRELAEAEAALAERASAEAVAIGALLAEARALAEHDPNALTDVQRTARSDVEFGLAQLEAWQELADEVERTNARLRGELDDLVTWLKRQIDGRICVIGYTASALADIKPIPTAYQGAPGVLVHANLLNALLAGQTVSWTPPWVNHLLAIGMGLLATLISVWRRPREALIIVVGLAVAYVVLAGWLPFHSGLMWVAVVAPLLATVGSFVGIATYRYMFVDRERRQLAAALGQYTSREIARQLAENPELCRRAEMREVTTMFTDLKGFTAISERIGAEHTQRVLNICLGRSTDVMLRHMGMVNKFLGDGVFVFWNPVIMPQPDHAVRACETAVDLLAELGKLKAEQAAAGDGVFAELQMRIGIATGNAVVGPCGSEQKYDYTCIGDSVNVAARLESANKFYGTTVLVSDDTRVAVGEAFVFRTLGAVQVKGKRGVVPIHELLGRAGEVPEETQQYAQKFARGVAHFQQREFEQAAAVFGARIQERPEDLAAMRYAELCARYHAQGPDEDWNGAIELTEK